jgi:chromosome segregation protein
MTNMGNIVFSEQLVGNARIIILSNCWRRIKKQELRINNKFQRVFLKKIEITGFKSFAKKTVLDFSSTGVFNGDKKNIGITTIVGPNGSGKSNVADALRWALGEQSSKNLRSKKSEDVIFAGSDKKAKLGSAQVSIYLDNLQKKGPVDYDEIVVTRKVYRSGEGEYLINGSKVRLVDVVDILAKGGIGQRSYCIINQGMADQVLNASLTERRTIIEEAAGVKEFQVKKDRSERKLKRTQTNLERVKGLLVEIEPHLKMLKRQSRKAQKGEEYRVELKKKQNQLFGFLWGSFKNNKKESEEKKNDLAREKVMLEREVDDLQGKLQKESSETNDLRDDINELEEKERDLNYKISNFERQLIVEEGKIELEKERQKNVEVVESIPVGTDLIKKQLLSIKTGQDGLVKRIEAVATIDDIKKLKEEAKTISDRVYELYEGVIKGRIEKKKPTDELNKQKEINLKKVGEMMERAKRIKSDQDKTKKEEETIKQKISDLIKRDREEKKEAIKLEDLLRRKQFDLDKVKDKYNEIRIEFAKTEIRGEDLMKRINQELNINPDKINYNSSDKIEAGKWENDIVRLKVLLEQSGAVDQTVLDEYDETQKRYDFLKKESEDLQEAIKSLRRVVIEMEANIKDKFEKTFQSIDKKFNDYFKIIFNGGKAKLKKVKISKRISSSEKNEENSSLLSKESDVEDEKEENEEVDQSVGVEIIAEPPGKKISNLRVLSGGERALTSIALLFAIISHNPPPFAILDEIEAALDEANSKRFGKILNQLSGKTQFILITHNRETMRQAAVLYGVTMGNDGISQLLSVKLDQVGEEGEIAR